MSLESKIRVGWSHYHAHTEWWCAREVAHGAPGMDFMKVRQATVIAYAPNANAALHQVHVTLQKNEEKNLDRQVIRPKLTPDEYRVIKMFIPYKDAKGAELEQVFDLPAGRNPDLRPDKSPGLTTPTMAFFEEAKGQGSLSK